MEITRTIQIQVTCVMNVDDDPTKPATIKSTEWIKEDIEKLFSDNDQVLVTVKDFINDGKKRGKR